MLIITDERTTLGDNPTINANAHIERMVITCFNIKERHHPSAIVITAYIIVRCRPLSARICATPTFL